MEQRPEIVMAVVASLLDVDAALYVLCLLPEAVARAWSELGRLSTGNRHFLPADDEGGGEDPWNSQLGMKRDTCGKRLTSRSASSVDWCSIILCNSPNNTVSSSTSFLGLLRWPSASFFREASL